MSDFNNMDEWDIDRGLPRRRQPGAAQSYGYASDNGAAQGYGYTGQGRTPRGNGYANQGGYNVNPNPNGRAPRRAPGYGYSQDIGAGSGKSRRKRNQKIKGIILVAALIVLIIGLIIAAVFIMKSHMPAKKSSDNDVYVRTVDITDAVVGNMAIWLSDIEGENIDAAWVKQKADDFAFTSVMIFGKDSEGNSTYKEAVEKESYLKLVDEADKTLSRILSEIIAGRLIREGYAESVSPEEAESIAANVLGMSMADYIRENGVNVVPTINEINVSYVLGNGTYKISKGVMNLTSNDGKEASEKIIKKKDSLVFIDSGRVYVKSEDISVNEDDLLEDSDDLLMNAGNSKNNPAGTNAGEEGASGADFSGTGTDEGLGETGAAETDVSNSASEINMDDGSIEINMNEMELETEGAQNED